MHDHQLTNRNSHQREHPSNSRRTNPAKHHQCTADEPSTRQRHTRTSRECLPRPQATAVTERTAYNVDSDIYALNEIGDNIKGHQTTFLRRRSIRAYTARDLRNGGDLLKVHFQGSTNSAVDPTFNPRSFAPSISNPMQRMPHCSPICLLARILASFAKSSFKIPFFNRILTHFHARNTGRCRPRFTTLSRANWR